MSKAAGQSEKSLVERVSALAGPEDRLRGPSGATVPTRALPAHPVQDGYLRVSPVQILYRAENYYRSLTKKCVGAAVALAAVVTALVFLLRR